MKKRTRAKSLKYRLGDIFYIPISDESDYVQFPNGLKGEYIVNENDQVCFGQIVHISEYHEISYAIFNTVTEQKKIDTININQITLQVSLIINGASSAVSRGYFPIIGNLPVTKLILNSSNLETDELTAKNFFEHKSQSDESLSSGAIVIACQKYFKIGKNKNTDFINLNDFSIRNE